MGHRHPLKILLELHTNRSPSIDGFREGRGRFLAVRQAVEREAPNWPGFRPECRDCNLSAELIAKRAEVEAEMDALDQGIRSAKSMPP